MRRILLMLVLSLLLCGCAAQETFETVADEPVLPVMAQPRQVSVHLPDDAVAPVLESDSEQLYLCQDYEILMEIVESGDLSGTITHISGYEKENLTVMETFSDGVSRYEFVWASAGETGDRLGRAVILDDGDYHYCMTVLRDADTTKTSQIVWEDVFSSFRLV